MAELSKLDIRPEQSSETIQKRTRIENGAFANRDTQPRRRSKNPITNPYIVSGCIGGLLLGGHFGLLWGIIGSAIGGFFGYRAGSRG